MRKLVLVMLASLAVGVGACGRDDARRAVAVSDAGEAAAILESTPWLDRAPESERDVIHAWVFPRGEGLYLVGNAYKATYELFQYFVEDDELRIRFLDDGKTHKLRFTIERVQHHPVFDYRLTLHGSPRGPKVYYGFDSHRGDALPAPLRAVIESRSRP